MLCSQPYYPHIDIVFRYLKRIKKIIIALDFSAASYGFKQNRKELLSMLDETIDNIVTYKGLYYGKSIKKHRSYINKLCKKCNKIYKLIFSLRKGITIQNDKMLNTQIKAFILANNCIKHLMYDCYMLRAYS